MRTGPRQGSPPTIKRTTKTPVGRHANKAVTGKVRPKRPGFRYNQDQSELDSIILVADLVNNLQIQDFPGWTPAHKYLINTGPNIVALIIQGIVVNVNLGQVLPITRGMIVRNSSGVPGGISFMVATSSPYASGSGTYGGSV